MNQRVTATITAESNLPLPIEVRERLGLIEGSVVTFVLIDDDVVLLRVSQRIDDEIENSKSQANQERTSWPESFGIAASGRIPAESLDEWKSKNWDPDW